MTFDLMLFFFLLFYTNFYINKSARQRAQNVIGSFIENFESKINDIWENKEQRMFYNF